MIRISKNNFLLLPFILLVVLSHNLFCQDSTKRIIPDSLNNASLKNVSLDSTLFFKTDSLSLKFSFPINQKLPKNVISLPKLPSNPLEIDTRTSSYYTPKNVQDKMDQIMNRPRRDSFLPVLAMAYFAARIAAQQLEIDRMFELNATDYLVTDDQFSILEKLWIKPARRIDDLYLTTDLKNETTAKGLQICIAILADKGLIKTRDAGENNIFFYPAQKSEKVFDLFISEMKDTSITAGTQTKLRLYFSRLQKITQQQKQ